jgi:cytochrome P450
MREAMRDYTFSNGITIPKGKVMVVPISLIHKDESFYENPTDFDGFRFSRMREVKGESGKHHSSNTSLEFLGFGHGVHSW